jgi:hypothetical protein
VDDRAAEFADALEGRGQVRDGEVRKGSGIAGTGSTFVDAEAQVVGVGLPPRSGRSGPWREGDPEDSEPEPPRAIGIVGWELDQWRGHGRKYGWLAVRARLLLCTSRDSGAMSRRLPDLRQEAAGLDRAAATGPARPPLVVEADGLRRWL